MAKKNKSLPQPIAVFSHATRFLITDTELRKLVEHDPGLEQFIQFPGMVISASASELHFKCLLEIAVNTLSIETRDTEAFWNTLAELRTWVLPTVVRNERDGEVYLLVGPRELTIWRRDEKPLAEKVAGHLRRLFPA